MTRIPDLPATLTRTAPPAREKRPPEAPKGEAGQPAGAAVPQSFSRQLAVSQGRREAAARAGAGEERPESTRAGAETCLRWLASILGAQLGPGTSGEGPVDAAAPPALAGPTVNVDVPAPGDGTVPPDVAGAAGDGPDATLAGKTSGTPLTAWSGDAAPLAAVEDEEGVVPPEPAAGDSATPDQAIPPLVATYVTPGPESAAPLVRQAATLDGGEPLAAALRQVGAPVGVNAPAMPLGPAPVGLTSSAPDPAHVIEQVLDQLLVRAEEPGGHEHLVLKLEPPELGRVEVRLEVNAGRLEVTLLAETHEAENALRSRSHELVQGLASRGGHWTDVQVRLERQEGQGRQEQRQDGRQEGRGAEERPDPRSGQDSRRRGQ